MLIDITHPTIRKPIDFPSVTAFDSVVRNFYTTILDQEETNVPFCALNAKMGVCLFFQGKDI